MAKQGGLGANYYVGGYDLSGDTQSLDSISGSVAPIDVTAINKAAMERIGGLRDGDLQWTSFFNPGLLAEHVALSPLPATDVGVMAVIATPTIAIGSPAACITAKQLDYAGTRAADGQFTFKVEAQANGFGLEWGQLLTAGPRTDTAATNGTALDTTASVSLGAQIYVQVFAFTGTDVTIKLQDSADNATFADLSGATLLVNSTTPQSQRIQLGATATVRRYIRVSTTTSGGFTNAQFAVAINKNIIAVAF